MMERRYPVHGAPGVAWILVYDTSARQWCVDEVTVEPVNRKRIPLAEFRHTAEGMKMAYPLAEAVRNSRAVRG